MSPFSSLTIWIVLATVIPGFITIAFLYLIFSWVFSGEYLCLPALNYWIGVSLAISIMIITQTFGILQEKMFMCCELYPKDIKGINGEDIDVENTYKRMYGVLAGLQKEDDTHGHMQRIIGQYFLTVNNLVAYVLSIIVVMVILLLNPELYSLRVVGFTLVMVLLYIFTFFVMRVRFRSMIQSVSVLQNRIAKREEKES